MSKDGDSRNNGNQVAQGGFLSGLRTAAREIAQEVRRDLNNAPPVGYASQSAQNATTNGHAPAAPVTGQGPAQSVFYHQAEADPEARGESPEEHARRRQEAEQQERLRALLLNPWPHLRNADMATHLRADAYFHPYTLADLDFYARDILPVTNPEIVSLVAVEAGEGSLTARLAELIGSSVGVYGSIGFNARNLQPDLDALDATLTAYLNSNPRVLAIGPVGLDAAYSPATLPQQRDQLLRQLEIAADFELPAIIFHNKAITQLKNALENTVLPRRLVWLKPIRTQEELDLIQQHDFFIILRAELTHPREEFYRQAITQVLPQRLLIGSGNSLNASHNRQGQFNSSGSLPDILKAAAPLLKLNPTALQARVNANFAQVYHIPE